MHLLGCTLLPQDADQLPKCNRPDSNGANAEDATTGDASSSGADHPKAYVTYPHARSQRNPRTNCEKRKKHSEDKPIECPFKAKRLADDGKTCEHERSTGNLADPSGPVHALRV